ncbi:MAG: FMN-binding negative transcriptional regulator [Caulobacterales bacterium]
MYGPAHFLVDDADAIAGMIAAYPLAVLAAQGHDSVVIAHAPLLVERGGGGAIVSLVGHVARANPFAALAPGAKCTAVFVGPDAYVSPSAYPSKAVHGEVVPTWNYVRAEVAGEVDLFSDRTSLLEVVRQLTDVMERCRPAPWSVDDAPAAYTDRMVASIVGVRIMVSQAQGKWKLSQNKSVKDFAGVMADLGAREAPRDHTLAQAMRALHREG